MQRQELAKHLGISPSMVTKLAKRGMPVDTVERAKRWRNRHLEPGRVKGSRMGTEAPPPLANKPAPTDEMREVPRPARVPTVEEITTLAEQVGQYMRRARHCREVTLGIRHVRHMLRAWCGSNPHSQWLHLRLPADVWLRLAEYTLPEAEDRDPLFPDPGQVVALREFHQALTMDAATPGDAPTSGLELLFIEACQDPEGYSETGYPFAWVVSDDDEPDSEAAPQTCNP